MTELVYGNVDGLGASLGRYAVMTQEIPWNLVKQRIGGTPVSITMVENLEREYLNRLDEELPTVDTVVGIGGGVTIDAAKYLAWKRKCSAVFVPTILSVNAYTTPASAVRQGGVVNYVGSVIPNKIVVDYRAIQSAPKRLNTAGTGDVYSCRTALFDWRLSRDKIGEPYDEAIAAGSERILDTLANNAEEIKNVTLKGIRTLVELHLETNRLQVAAGKPRPEEGSEHIFFYCLEELTGRNFLHGEVVGTGIFVATYFQSKEEDLVARAMDRMGLMFRPRDYGITEEEFVSAVLNMKAYSERTKRFFSIVDIVDITRRDAEKLWTKLSA
jgi:glycerol-1-phosphate dehydrogenase [NAD(P)+]